jgi:hypothetical protein
MPKLTAFELCEVLGELFRKCRSDRDVQLSMQGDSNYLPNAGIFHGHIGFRPVVQHECCTSHVLPGMTREPACSMLPAGRHTV